MLDCIYVSFAWNMQILIGSERERAIQKQWLEWMDCFSIIILGFQIKSNNNGFPFMLLN